MCVCGGGESNKNMKSLYSTGNKHPNQKTSQAGQKEQHNVSQSTTNTREPLYRRAEYYTSRNLMTFESDYKKIYT